MHFWEACLKVLDRLISYKAASGINSALSFAQALTRNHLLGYTGKTNLAYTILNANNGGIKLESKLSNTGLGNKIRY